MKKKLLNKCCGVLAAGFAGFAILAQGALVTIDLDETYQTIDGFGTSIIYGGSTGLYTNSDFLDFVAYDLGMSMFRMEIRPGMSPVAMEDPADIRWENFPLDDPELDGASVKLSLNFSRGLMQRQPETRLIGSVWTPPAWMKDNQSLTGAGSGANRLSNDKYAHYAKYLVEYVDLFENQGVPVYAMSPANEPRFSQDFQSCTWDATEYANIVRRIGETFAQEGLQRPLAFGTEDMTREHYGQTRYRGYVNALLAEGTGQYFDIFATHGYTDGVQSGGVMDPEVYWDSIERFQKPYWVTEGGTGGHGWPVPITTGIGGYLHHALVNGHVSAFVAWQISEIEPSDNALMLRETPTKKTYAAMHYWRYIRPGFVRVDAELSGGDSDGLRISAFRDEEKSRVVIVVINTNNSERELDFSLFGSTTAVTIMEAFQTTGAAEVNFQHAGSVDITGSESFTLPAQSIVTLATLISVSGVSLPDAVEIDVGDETQIHATLYPGNATNRKLSWESSNPSVATVDEVGLVTGVDTGEAEITVTSDDGEFEASTTVNVRFLQWAQWPVESAGYVNTGDSFIGRIFAWKNSDWIYSFRLNKWLYLPENRVGEDHALAYLARHADSVTEGETEQSVLSFAATAGALSSDEPPFVALAETPVNALLNKSITVSSEVKSDGPKANLIDGDFGANFESTRWVTTFSLEEPPPPEWAKIDMGALYHMSEFRLYPAGGRDYRYTISVSEDDVDYEMVVNRLNNQGASVYTDAVDIVGRYVLLEAFYTESAAYKGPWVNLQELVGMGSLVEVSVSGTHLVPASVQRGVGQSYALHATVEPSIATDKRILWSSDNTNAVTVDENGTLTAVAEGTAEITATTVDGGFSAKTVVTVGPDPIWGEWVISNEGLIQTGAFCGDIFKPLPSSDWIYLYDAGCWAWLPESALTDEGVWVQLIR